MVLLEMMIDSTCRLFSIVQPSHRTCVHSITRDDLVGNVLICIDNSQDTLVVLARKGLLHCVNGVYQVYTHKGPQGLVMRLCMGCCLLYVCLQSICVNYQKN
jgi:hypothetical protein